jgi:hypothetical protein
MADTARVAGFVADRRKLAAGGTQAKEDNSEQVTAATLSRAAPISVWPFSFFRPLRSRDPMPFAVARAASRDNQAAYEFGAHLKT